MTKGHTKHNEFQVERPADFPNALTNHTNLSPVNSNSMWNSDSWGDGEFEPIDESSTGKLAYSLGYHCSALF